MGKRQSWDKCTKKCKRHPAVVAAERHPELRNEYLNDCRDLCTSGKKVPGLAGFGATKAEKKLDKEIEAIYYRYGSGVQINIMDIGKIFRAGRDAHARGEPMEPAIVAAIQALRVNGLGVHHDRKHPGPSTPSWAQNLKQWVVLDTRSGTTKHVWFNTEAEAHAWNQANNAGFVQHASSLGGLGGSHEHHEGQARIWFDHVADELPHIEDALKKKQCVRTLDGLLRLERKYALAAANGPGDSDFKLNARLTDLKFAFQDKCVRNPK